MRVCMYVCVYVSGCSASLAQLTANVAVLVDDIRVGGETPWARGPVGVPAIWAVLETGASEALQISKVSVRRLGRPRLAHAAIHGHAEVAAVVRAVAHKSLLVAVGALWSACCSRRCGSLGRRLGGRCRRVQQCI